MFPVETLYYIHDKAAFGNSFPKQVFIFLLIHLIAIFLSWPAENISCTFATTIDIQNLCVLHLKRGKKEADLRNVNLLEF